MQKNLETYIDSLFLYQKKKKNFEIYIEKKIMILKIILKKLRYLLHILKFFK